MNRGGDDYRTVWMVEQVSGLLGNLLLTGAFAAIRDLAGACDDIVRTVAEGRSSPRKDETCCKG
jgi:hypothetical protein